MDQPRVYDVSRVNRQDGRKGRGVRHFRILPDGERVDLIADEVNFVLLTKPHKFDENPFRIASTLEIIRSRVEKDLGL